MINKKDFNPIGIGTFKLDLDNKEKTLEALLYSVDQGQNFMSTSLLYDNYNVVDFLYNFFKKIDKDNIFLTCHLEPYIEKREDVEKQLDEYLKRMNIDYVDALQIHVSYASKIPLLETYEEIDKLVKKEKVRYISASNTTFEELKEIQKNFKLYSFEGVYNLESQNFTIEKADLDKLNNFQDERFNAIEIDWRNEGGITIDKLASQFKIE